MTDCTGPRYAHLDKAKGKRLDGWMGRVSTRWDSLRFFFTPVTSSRFFSSMIRNRF